jgi:hypothetical protein
MSERQTISLTMKESSILSPSSGSFDSAQNPYLGYQISRIPKAGLQEFFSCKMQVSSVPFNESVPLAPATDSSQPFIL